MQKMILFISLVVLVQGCVTNKPKDLLGFQAEENYPDNKPIVHKRLPVYVMKHQNAMGDQVTGTWVRVEDPR